MAVSRRRIDPDQGRAAVAQWAAGGMPPSASSAAAEVPRSVIATAVRYSLEEVTARAPGNSVEVRVPPFGVTQCVEGPRHTRGTPPNVIECDAATWLAMVTGRMSWADAVDAGRVAASGLRADLSALLPL
ncbi:sterol carrier family protein [Arthrobacter sp. ZGTC131]|uniref:sterol carrier family protein n=1 Tax=Arthrobacter sp. ZGTC131 TaxID=2058898 RepID=UPI000CE36587|nr:sterol carrier family protein [Arthrobacter sp. ZGTC131]